MCRSGIRCRRDHDALEEDAVESEVFLKAGDEVDIVSIDKIETSMRLSVCALNRSMKNAIRASTVSSPGY